MRGVLRCVYSDVCTFAFSSNTPAFVLWYALATSFSPLSWAARAALAVTAMRPDRASRMMAFSPALSMLGAFAIVRTPLGYARCAQVKYTTFLVVSEWICGITVMRDWNILPPADGFISGASIEDSRRDAAILFHV